ncbi:ROK family glucokinase [Gottschalkiaceae bacterium SANA]|nr:ROK family glucokinase [Gottschalkiaceae bacterium SANA]
MRYQRSNKRLIKQVNLRSILQYLWHHNLASRAEIARSLQLNPATITNLTRELKDEGWLLETGDGDSSGGRPPVLLKLNREMIQMIGVDVGIKSMKFSLVNGFGILLKSWRIEEAEIQTGDDLLMHIMEGIKNLQVNIKTVLGIGIGMHGLVDRKQGMIQYAPAFKVEDYPLGEKLEAAWGCMVVLDNDVRAMAMAERWFGLAQNVSDFFLINLGDGVGGAFAMGGRIQSGGAQMAGEIGHITVPDHDKVLCNCGRTGCLETEISSGALARKYRKRTGKTCENGKAIYDYACQGDPDAKAVFAEMGVRLGQTMGLVVQLLNPELIILAGGVSGAWDVFQTSFLSELESHSVSRTYRTIRVEPTRLGGEAGVLGAATLVIEEWMDSHKGEIE